MESVTVRRYKAEAAKLRAVHAFIEADSDEKLLIQRKQMEKSMRSVQAQIDECREEDDLVHKDITNVTAFAETLQARLDKREVEFEGIKSDNAVMANRLAILTKEKNRLELETKRLETNLISQIPLFESTINEQHRLIQASKQIESITNDNFHALTCFLEDALEKEDREASRFSLVGESGLKVNEVLELQSDLVRDMIDSVRKSRGMLQNDQLLQS